MNEITADNPQETVVDDDLLTQLREAQIKADEANKRLEALKSQVQNVYFGTQIIPIGETRVTVSGNTISLGLAGKEGKTKKLTLVGSSGESAIEVSLTMVGETTKTFFDEEYLRRQAARLKLDFNKTFCNAPVFNPSKVTGAWENGVISDRVYDGSKITEPVEQTKRFSVKV